jgi:hypothetical protein
VCRLDDDL